jgi:hypothetical protein
MQRTTTTVWGKRRVWKTYKCYKTRNWKMGEEERVLEVMKQATLVAIDKDAAMQTTTKCIT